MTPIALVKLNKPAETKPIVAIVVTLEDWTSAVIDTPVSRAFVVEPVNLASQSLRAFPAKAFKPSVIKIMPSRKRPIPPIRFVIKKYMQYSSKKIISL
jgi:hypothetical protein